MRVWQFQSSWEANAWQLVTPDGDSVGGRTDHAAVWAETPDGLYVFGGRVSRPYYLNDLYFYSRQAWREDFDWTCAVMLRFLPSLTHEAGERPPPPKKEKKAGPEQVFGSLSSP